MSVLFSLKSPAMFSKVMERVGVKGVPVPFMVKPEKLGEAIHSIRIFKHCRGEYYRPLSGIRYPFHGHPV